MDRERIRAISGFQNAADLAAAKRRQLHAPVGPPVYRASMAFIRPRKMLYQKAAGYTVIVQALGLRDHIH